LNKITFSIITVSYNSAEFIRTAIESVLYQHFENIEYIIVDGGSTDGTVEIVRSYGEQITKFVSEPDKGIYDAMNKGIALATGDVIGILNSDDFYPNQHVISDVVQCFEENANVDMVFGNVDFVYAKDLNKSVRFYSSFRFSPWKLRIGFMPPHPAAFIKRSVYDKVGLYKLGYKIAADFEMFVRMLMVHKLTYAKLDQTLVRMRIGGVSTSGLNSNWVASEEMVRSLKGNGVYSNLLLVFIRLPVKFLQRFKIRD